MTCYSIKGKTRRLKKRGRFIKPHQYKCKLSLYDPYLINELTIVAEQDQQRWAKKMRNFIIRLKTAVADADGKLHNYRMNNYRAQYRKLIKVGKIESMQPSQFLKSGKNKKIIKTRSQVLLDKLIENETHVFTFTENATQRTSNS